MADLDFATRLRSGRGQWLLLSLLGVLLVFALLSWGLRSLSAQLADNQVFAVLVDDRQLLLDGKTLRAFNQQLEALSAEHASKLDQDMQTWIDLWLAQGFDRAEQAVPAYLDWYYSLPGSYTRLYLAVTGQLESGTSERLYRYLFEHSGAQQHFAEFDQALTQELSRRLAEQGTALRQRLVANFAEQQVVLGDKDTPVSVDIDRAINRAFGPGERDVQRWQISAQASAVAGVGSLGLLARRALLPRLASLPALQSARLILSGYAARLAPRLSAAISSGGAAAVATSPSGPGALATGAVVFMTAAGTIVVTDFAVLKAEEAMLRDDQEQALYAGLAEQQDLLRAKLKGQWRALLDQAAGHRDDALAAAYDSAELAPRFHIFGRR